MAKKKGGKRAEIYRTHENDTEPFDTRTGLRPKELSFALWMVTNDGELVKSYCDAGYAPKSMSHALTLAERLAADPRVRAVIDKRLAENSYRYRNDALRVLEELKTISYSSKDDFEIVDGDVRVRPGVDPRAIRAVKSVKSVVTENHRTGDIETKVSFELWSKEKGIELSMRHHGLLQPELPPIEQLFSRLDADLVSKLKDQMTVTDEERAALGDGPVVDESMVDLPLDVREPVE